MKLKLSHSQFQALYSLFTHHIIGIKPEAMEGKLLHAILISIYEKLYKKAFVKKPKYSLALSNHEALAFWLFFTKFHYMPEDMIYEANLVDTINNSIHQKFSS